MRTDNSNLVVKYADHIIDPAEHPDYSWFVEIWISSTVKKIGEHFLFFSNVSFIHMEGVKSVESLPDFSDTGMTSAFSSEPNIRLVYFAEEVFDEFFLDFNEAFPLFLFHLCIYDAGCGIVVRGKGGQNDKRTHC